MESQTKIKAIQVNTFGPETVINEIPKPKPAPHQVLIKVAYSPINPADHMSMMGTYPGGFVPPCTIGFEGSGIIEAVGESCKVTHKVGAKVSFICKGAWTEYVVTSSDCAIEIHEGNTLENAAAHYINPMTALIMLDIVKKAGAKAVVHDAGMSALGKMLIKLFKKEGIKSINLVRKDEYFPSLTELGSDHNLNITSDFSKDLEKVTKEFGATIYFSAVGGDTTGKVLTALPPKSVAYVYGALSSHILNGIPVPELLFEGKKLEGFWLTSRFEEYSIPEKVGMFNTIQKNLTSIFKTEFTVFDYADIKKALEHLKTKSSQSKALLKFNSI
jgi:NADPH2:quinone reductase